MITKPTVQVSVTRCTISITICTIKQKMINHIGVNCCVQVLYGAICIWDMAEIYLAYWVYQRVSLDILKILSQHSLDKWQHYNWGHGQVSLPFLFVVYKLRSTLYYINLRGFWLNFYLISASYLRNWFSCRQVTCLKLEMFSRKLGLLDLSVCSLPIARFIEFQISYKSWL